MKRDLVTKDNANAISQVESVSSGSIQYVEYVDGELRIVGSGSIQEYEYKDWYIHEWLPVADSWNKGEIVNTQAFHYKDEVFKHVMDLPGNCDVFAIEDWLVVVQDSMVILSVCPNESGENMADLILDIRLTKEKTK